MELNSNSENKLNVLIVEDDPICGFLATMALQNYYNITIVTNGYDALEQLKKQNYDVILMDINLNDAVMDGIRTMRTIRFDRKHNHIKILAVTASSDDRQWYLKQGFDGHYMKPIVEKEIVIEISKCTERRVVPASQNYELAKQR